MMLTDFHSHILPGVDDGSESVAESLEMLRLSAQQGVTRLVATPHFYPRKDSPERFLRRRARAYGELEEALENGLPQIVLGAEVYFFKGISECDEIQSLTLGGKKHILVEMPMSQWTEGMYRELEQIYIRQGLVPVVAHLDRYLRPFTWRKVVGQLSDLPVLVQVNGEFFTNRRTEKQALSMLQKGQIHAIGSDCHNLTDRKPNLDQATACIRDKLGEPALERLARYADKIL